MDPWVLRRSLEEETAAPCSISGGTIPWAEGPGRLQSWGGKESDATEQARNMLWCFANTLKRQSLAFFLWRWDIMFSDTRTGTCFFPLHLLLELQSIRCCCNVDPVKSLNTSECLGSIRLRGCNWLITFLGCWYSEHFNNPLIVLCSLFNNNTNDCKSFQWCTFVLKLNSTYMQPSKDIINSRVVNVVIDERMRWLMGKAVIIKKEQRDRIIIFLQSY